MTGHNPRRLGLLGLLVLVPLSIYWLRIEKVGFAPALSFACVLLIVGSLWTMFTPPEGAGGVGH